MEFLEDKRCDLAGVLQNTKTPQVWKYENTKKLQNHPFPAWPQKSEKNTEKLQNWPENDHFCNFSVFFSYFWGQTGNGWFCNFFVFFSYFQTWGVFVLCSTPGRSQDKRSWENQSPQKNRQKSGLFWASPILQCTTSLHTVDARPYFRAAAACLLGLQQRPYFEVPGGPSISG